MFSALLFWVFVGYLCGSIPFALLLGKARGIDVRKIGSGNVGSTNLGRALGRKWGILCFLLDMLKGLLPVLAAGLALGYAGRWDLPERDAWCWLAVALAPMVGHIFPVWLNFRGGKGVATGMGVVLGFWPLLTLPGLAAGLTWFVVIKLCRIMSLASIAGACSLPVYVALMAWIAPETQASVVALLIVTVTMGALITVRHRANLTRIVAGTEPKIGVKTINPPSHTESL